jgi:hypothetical protein
VVPAAWSTITPLAASIPAANQSASTRRCHQAAVGRLAWKPTSSLARPHAHSHRGCHGQVADLVHYPPPSFACPRNEICNCGCERRGFAGFCIGWTVERKGSHTKFVTHGERGTRSPEGPAHPQHGPSIRTPPISHPQINITGNPDGLSAPRHRGHTDSTLY